MKKLYLFAAIITLLPDILKAEEKTYVPDNNFEQYLIKLGYDNELDNYIFSSSAEQILSLNVANKSISSLQGIESFKNLQDLYCPDNYLTSLDVRGLKHLERIICRNNRLTSLKVDSCTSLQYLYCENNQLASFDLSTNTALVSIGFKDNLITSIDVSHCKVLEYIYSENNQLTSLDVGANILLKTLWCFNNQLTSLNLSSGFMQELYCSGNQLTGLNIKDYRYLERLDCNNNLLSTLDVSSNRKLKRLLCNNNLLTNLNVSANPDLELFYCNSNQLASLNLKNGNNHNLNGGLPGVLAMDAKNNPNLTCIQVDDPVAAAGYTWKKDAAAIYSADCGYEDLSLSMAYIPDDNFEQALIDYGYDFGSLNDSVSKSSIDTILTLDVSDRNIEDLTGISEFTSLEELDCSHNKLTTMQAENIMPLTHLYCIDNQIQQLDIRNYNSLTYINCSQNKLSNISVSMSPTLKSVQYSETQSSGLILNQDAPLKELFCQENQLTGIDLSNYSTLEKLDCNNNQLTSLNLKNGNNIGLTVMNATNNPKLSCIQVDDPVAARSFSGWGKDVGANYSVDCGYEHSTGNITLPGPVGEIKIYPNPVSGKLYIELSIGTSPFNLKIIDILGRVIRFQKSFSGESINVSGLPSGIYYISLQNKKETYNARFVKK